MVPVVPVLPLVLIGGDMGDAVTPVLEPPDEAMGTIVWLSEHRRVSFPFCCVAAVSCSWSPGKLGWGWRDGGRPRRVGPPPPCVHRSLRAGSTCVFQLDRTISVLSSWLSLSNEMEGYIFTWTYFSDSN